MQEKWTTSRFERIHRKYKSTDAFHILNYIENWENQTKINHLNAHGWFSTEKCNLCLTVMLKLRHHIHYDNKVLAKISTLSHCCFNWRALSHEFIRRSPGSQADCQIEWQVSWRCILILACELMNVINMIYYDRKGYPEQRNFIQHRPGLKYSTNLLTYLYKKCWYK